jgi:hypothetical protein
MTEVIVAMLRSIPLSKSGGAIPLVVGGFISATSFVMRLSVSGGNIKWMTELN